jgi:hypothetical protein
MYVCVKNNMIIYKEKKTLTIETTSKVAMWQGQQFQGVVTPNNIKIGLLL